MMVNTIIKRSEEWHDELADHALLKRPCDHNPFKCLPQFS